MCLDFPGQVVERHDAFAVVECAGRCRRASTLLYPDLAVGDWVYVAAGTVVERLDDQTAQMINREIAIAKGVGP
ncbi:MAG TPA: HypC/HybG/HupF family hydrogenase formation chaperone [Candidatus Limnocylindrales bacterium]|nr:HypC/HybG/HupF family hydrogenase formation chaperone [Candidatus Limnocylindrales bacterium]